MKNSHSKLGYFFPVTGVYIRQKLLPLRSLKWIKVLLEMPWSWTFDFSSSSYHFNKRITFDPKYNLISLASTPLKNVANLRLIESIISKRVHLKKNVYFYRLSRMHIYVSDYIDSSISYTWFVLLVWNLLNLRIKEMFLLVFNKLVKYKSINYQIDCIFSISNSDFNIQNLPKPHVQKTHLPCPGRSPLD